MPQTKVVTVYQINELPFEFYNKAYKRLYDKLSLLYCGIDDIEINVLNTKNINCELEKHLYYSDGTLFHQITNEEPKEIERESYVGC